MPHPRPWITAVSLLTAMVLSGCSTGSTSSPAPSRSSDGATAARICDSLLNGPAAPALERLTGSKHFRESLLSENETVKGTGQARTALLHDTSFVHNGKAFDLCRPVATDGMTGGQLTISTNWLRLRSGDYTWKSHGDWRTIDILGSGKKD